MKSKIMKEKEPGYAIFNLYQSDSGSKLEAALSAEKYFEYVGIGSGEAGCKYVCSDE